MAEGADGVYKITQSSKNSNNKIKGALRFLLTRLAPNELALLKGKADLTGTDPTELLLGMIQSGTSSVESTQIAYDKTATNGANTDASGNKKTTPYDEAMMLTTGDGLQQTTFELNPGTQYSMQAIGQRLPSIAGAQGDGPLTKVIEHSKISGILNNQAVHVGNQLINPAQLGQLYYDGTGLATAELPYTVDGNGQPLPNFALIDTFTRAKKVQEAQERKFGRKLAPNEINAIFKAHKLDDYYGPDQKLNARSFMRFATMNVMGDDQVLEDPDDNDYLKLQKENKYITSRVNALLGSKQVPFKSGDLYKGMAYVPIYDSPSGARVSSGNYSHVQDYGAMTELAAEQHYNRSRGKQYNNQINKNSL